ncbi:class III signal peptide-containing protein [Palaeococcus ferrophilus]|uniref:class III signal peptide-containing protein n=1 Tax=Palaeococcus ferrophilus TaxID=83868 RepID=UPI00064E72A3|nr:class III signal peptide-containing protein [Palaeococcus ferrophilus]
MKRFAQGSVEYLFLLGATIVIILVVVGYIATFSHNMANSTAETNNQNVKNVMDKIANISSEEING